MEFELRMLFVYNMVNIGKLSSGACDTTIKAHIVELRGVCFEKL